jgi:hypothetical protein
MTELSTIDLVGFWIGIFLTFCILSFLYKDNPFYKLAEHIFVGTSIGYGISLQYYDVLSPKLVDRLSESEWLALIPLALVLMLFTKALNKRWAWIGRYPVAFVVALFAGIQINAVAQADLGAQIKRSMVSLDEQKVDVNHASETELGNLPGVSPGVARQIIAQREQQPFTSIDQVEAMASLTPLEREGIGEERGVIKGLDAQASVVGGERYWFGIISNILLLLGLIASLIYFYFSVAHKGAIGKVSRFGVWVLMIGFGASFGYTVQGRIALAIGRAQDVLGTTMDKSDAAQVNGPLAAIICVAIIVAGIVFWELRNKKKTASASTSA